MSQKNIKKCIFDFSPSDFETYPVWRYDHGEEEKYGDGILKPVQKLPVDSLKSAIIGVPVQLANGKRAWGAFYNIRLSDARKSEHFLSFSVEKEGKWFALGRYFDPWYHRANPEALANFLGMNIDDVFPIAYDLR